MILPLLCQKLEDQVSFGLKTCRFENRHLRRFLDVLVLSNLYRTTIYGVCLPNFIVGLETRFKPKFKNNLLVSL